MHVEMFVLRPGAKDLTLMARVTPNGAGKMQVEEVTPLMDGTMDVLRMIREKHPNDDKKFLETIVMNYIRSTRLQAKLIEG